MKSFDEILQEISKATDKKVSILYTDLSNLVSENAYYIAKLDGNNETPEFYWESAKKWIVFLMRSVVPNERTIREQGFQYYPYPEYYYSPKQQDLLRLPLEHNKIFLSSDRVILPLPKGELIAPDPFYINYLAEEMRLK